MGKAIGIVTALTVTFVILKALGYLNWSWWLVFAPVWIAAILLAIAGIIVLILFRLAMRDD